MSNNLAHPKYRPDIDGLRAVAVLSVVIFHAFPTWLKGGFIGVDIFFVISGFLISTIIFENLEKGTFSFTEFYSRRVRRIYPALVLVIVACLVFGWFALLVDEYKQLGKHVAAGAAFVSNFVLWNESGYFDNASDTKLLLHLWSLAVEEQFYIIWPLILWFMYTRRINLLLISLLIAVISFSLNLYEVKADAVTAFYSPQTRFWELMAGSILAWATLHKHDVSDVNKGLLDKWFFGIISTTRQNRGDSSYFANLISVLALLLITYGFFRIDEDIGFPGKWALIPVLGAVLIIFAGPSAWVNRWLLSNKYAVWVGLISFPLYLWHWPLLSFARVIESEAPNRNIRIIAVLLAMVLSWLTYKFIERPIRSGKYAVQKTIILLLLMSFLGILGYWIFVKNDAHNVDNILMVDPSDHKDAAAINCRAFFPNWTKVNDNPCKFQKKSGNTLAIIGDSHAGHLYPGLSEMFRDKGGVVAFPASCAVPYLDISSGTSDPNTSKVRVGNYQLINSAYDYILRDTKIKTVVLAHHPLCSFGDVKDMVNPTVTTASGVFEAGMRRSFLALRKAHKQAIVILDNPFLPYQPEMCVKRPFRFTDHGNKCSFPRSYFDSTVAYSNYKSALINVAEEFPEVQIVDLSKILCDDHYCYLEKNGQLLYKDRGHLSFAGSRYVAPYIVDAINLLH